MPKPVISVEHLVKKYDLGVVGTGTLTRDLDRWWARVRGKPDPYSIIGQDDAFNRFGETILALNDVSFTVEKGEALGIIGRNGAGKSTLLKILSRVTAPTSGEVKVKGRIGSLLEVGTGFHPELTGRENVYLNGAILGMKKAEVARKFDEIVDFSGVEKFIDTPVKRYSSGMYVRLAFAVAAHLDPEILIVDEVLAVGDAEFQKKCLGKMGEVTGAGRTVLFVSHNMGSIRNLCQRSLLLKDGSIIEDNDTETVIEEYLNSLETHDSEEDLTTITRAPHLKPIIKKIEILDKSGTSRKIFPIESEIKFKIHFNNKEIIRNPYLGLSFENLMGIRVFWVQTKVQVGSLPDISPSGAITCHIKKLPLVGGNYFINIGCGTGNTQLDGIQKATSFQVVDTGHLKTGKNHSPSLGLVVVDADWEVD